MSKTIHQIPELVGYKNNYPQPLEKFIIISKNIIPDIIYECCVSSYGRVFIRTNTEWNEVTQYRKPNGYIVVHIPTERGIKSLHVHRLVMIGFNYFNGCEKYDVNHKDTVRDHNWIWNLEWCTRRENIKHAIREGKMGLGENATGSKYSNELVNKLCQMLDDGIDIRTIASIIGMKYHNVYEISRGNTWLCISKNYNFLMKQIPKFFTDKEVDDIIFQATMDREVLTEEILARIGYDSSMLNYPYNIIAINLTNYIRYKAGLDIII